MSLYNKYRPAAFEQVIGNTEAVNTLKSLIDKDDPPHAYLIHGPHGCGKTTLARIAAAKLGCIGEDFREIDSADFRGIDTIREMRNASAFHGLHGKRRAWLLDECHQLSRDAQNALLKALEEPPSHVYYFLCTTEPQKLLDTVKDRCFKVEVKLLTEIQMKRLLRSVVIAEKQELAKEVYDQIIQTAQGHARTALVILEKVLSHPPEERLQIARQSVDLEAKIIDLCRALIGGAQWHKVRQILAGLKDEQPESIRRAVLQYCATILLSREDDRIAAIMEAFAQNTFDSGFPGIIFSCYAAVKGT